MKQVWVILNKLGMRHAKPYPHDHRKPDDAESVLKNLGHVSIDEYITGFLDESTPQTPANTVRL